MEKNTKNGSSCVCGCGGHNHHNVWWRLIKAFGGCLIILLVLLVGIAAGRKTALLEGNWSYSNMTGAGKNYSLMMRPAGGLPANAVYLSGGNGGVVQSAPSNPVTTMPNLAVSSRRVAGVITDVTGTAITILDNGGDSQIIYSTSTTDIYSGTKEVPLSSLKAKEFVVSYVVTKNNQEVAERIEISQ